MKELCLYSLDKYEYEALTKEIGYECTCPRCRYFEQRVACKASVPRRVYENDIFQASLRYAEGLRPR